MTTPPFRANPSSTIRLQAATVAGAAPLLPGLAVGGGSDVLIVNRGSVPVLVEFGAKATMALPTAPTDTVPGSQSIPVGAAAIQRLQADQRHVAVAVLSGAPDIEFTIGQGSAGVYGIGGSGGSGASSADPATGARQDTGNANTAAIAAATGSTTDAATTSGANTTIVGALRAIRDRLLGTLTTTISGVVALGATPGAGGITAVARIVSAAASTNATSAKAAPGRIYKITGYNAATSIRWLRFYNTAAAPVPGTTAAWFAVPLPPSSVFSFDAADIGFYASVGIGFAITAGAPDADATAIAAGDILNLNVWVQ